LTNGVGRQPPSPPQCPVGGCWTNGAGRQLPSPLHFPWGVAGRTGREGTSPPSQVEDSSVGCQEDFSNACQTLCSVGVLFVNGMDSPFTSPVVVQGTDPLEVLGTPEIVPDRQYVVTDSPIVNTVDRYVETNSPSDWGVELSSTTPLPREEYLLSTIPNPTNDSPFWTDSSPSSAQTHPVPIPSSMFETMYSQGSTPDSRHGPSVYFSKKLRQRILISRGKKRNSGKSISNNAPSGRFSPQIQRLIAAEVSGITRLDTSNQELHRN